MAPRISSSAAQSAPLQTQSPEQPAKVSLPILAEEAVEKVNLRAVAVALEVLNAHRDTYTRKLLDKCMAEMQAVIERDNRKLGAEKDQSGCIQYRRLTQNQLMTLCCTISQAEPVMGSLDRYSCKFQFDNYQPIITIKDNAHHNGVELYFGHQQDEGELAAGEVQGASLLELQEFIKSSHDLNITIPPTKIWRYCNDYPTADPGANSLQTALYMAVFHGEYGNTFMSSQQRNDIFDFAIIGTQQDQMKNLSVGFLYRLSEAIKNAKLDNTTGCLYTTIEIGSDVYTIKERIIDKPAASGRTTEDPLEASGADSEPDFDTITSRFDRSRATHGLLRSLRSDCSEDSIVEHFDRYSNHLAALQAGQPIKYESEEEYIDVVRPGVIDICDSDGTTILTIPHITIGQLNTVFKTTHFPSVNIDAIESAVALNAEVKQPNWQVERLYNFAIYGEFKEYCIDFFANTFDIQKEKDPEKFIEFAVSIVNSLIPDFPVNNKVIKASLDSCQQVKPSIKILPILNIETIEATGDSYRACFNEYLEEPGKSKGRNNKMVLPIMCKSDRLCLLFIQHNPNKRSLTIHSLQPFTPSARYINSFLEAITKGNKKVTEAHVFLMDNAGLYRPQQNNSAVHALLVLGCYVKMADPSPDAAYEQYKSDLRQFEPTADIEPMTIVRCSFLSQVGACLIARKGSTASALPLDRPAPGIKHH